MNPDDDMEALLDLVAKDYEPGQITAHQVWSGYPPDDNKVDLDVYKTWKMTDHFQEYAIFQSSTQYRWHLVNLATSTLYGRWPSLDGARQAMREIVLHEKNIDIIQALQKMSAGGSVPNPAKKKPRSYASMVTDLGKHIPGFYDLVNCPECSWKESIYQVVQHLNDIHKWPRSVEAGEEWEKNTADWLESLDADLTVHQDEVEHTLIDWTKKGAKDGLSIETAILDEAQDVMHLLEDGEYGPKSSYEWAGAPSTEEQGKKLKEAIEALSAPMPTPKHSLVTDTGKIQPSAAKVEHTLSPEVAEQLEALQQTLEPVKQAWGEIQTAMQQIVDEMKKIDWTAITEAASTTTEEDTEDEHEDH